MSKINNKYYRRRQLFYHWLNEACKRYQYKVLGKKIHVHPQTLSKWHRGKQNIANFRLKKMIEKLRWAVWKFDKRGV